MALAPRLVFLVDQFRPRPEPEETEAALDRVYDVEAELDFYSAHLREGLYDSEQRVVERGHLASGQALLDVGCGAGREAHGFHALGLRVTAVDSSAAMVRRARELAEGLPIRFEVAGLSRLDFEPESFDAAYISSDVYQKTPGRAHRVRALAQFLRLLRPGGRVIFPVTTSAASSVKLRLLVDAPLSLLRRFAPDHALEPGDRFFRPAAGAPPVLTHVFSGVDEVADEIADAGLALVDHVGTFFVARTPGGDLRLQKAPGARWSDTDNGVLVADLERGTSLRLNPTAGRMLDVLAKGQTLAELGKGLTEELGAPPEVLEADARALASELIRERVLVPRVGGQ